MMVQGSIPCRKRIGIGDRMKKVNLDELAAALEQTDVRQGYVDLAQGRVILLQEDMGEDAALDHALEIEEDWERYLPLPNVLDEAERDIMASFAASRPREDVRERLQDILAGAGAAARFHRQVHHLLLQPAWEAHKRACLRDIARDWCDENHIEYQE